MTEETLFAAALEQADPAAYLDAHCPDPEARRRVEELLAAHAAAGSFLNHPAVGAEVTTALPPADPGATRTQASTAPDATADPRTGPADPADALAFLKPPTRPGSLGRLAHYEVLEVLGSGGFGTVFKAFDDRLHRVVAVKVLAPQLAASGAARQRFERESKSAAAVRDDHVVNVYAVSEPGDPLPFLVMEFVAGQTLQAKADKAGPLPPKEVLRIGSQIARGLAAAHKQGLIHRDIKPANILLENGVERVKVTDFGLARAADDASISHSGVVAGTPMFMSPEQARGDTLDTRSDLFSLGSVLYVLCTGRPPFRADSTLAVLKRVVEDDPRPVREVNPEVPRWLADVVAKLHAKAPADRFQTAAEVAELLSGYLAELQQQGTVVSRVAPPKRARRKPRRWAWAAGCLLLAAVPVLALALGLGLPAWQRMTNRDRGAVLVAESLGFESVRVHRDGQPVEDWTDVTNGHTFQLPPGRYTLEPRLAPDVTVAAWEVTTNKKDGPITARLPGGRLEFDLAPGGRVVVRAETTGPTTRRTNWGEYVDPLGDCKVSEDAGGLTLTVPAGNHDLSPVLGANMNGPRVLRDAVGDFEARVVVPPLPKPKAGTSSRADGVSYVGAGLAVWSDDKIAFRLFRAGLATNNNGAPFAQCEWFPPGTDRGHAAKYVPDGPVHLRLRRAGGTLHPAYSTDGKTWKDLEAVTNVPLAARLRVGVAAVSTYHQEVAFRLDGPTLQPAAAPADLTGWGQLHDPAGDCRVGFEKGALRLTLPAGNHDLSSAPAGNMRAPRVWEEFAGDFQFGVRVGRTEAAGAGRGGGAERAFAGAGLVVWRDDEHFAGLVRGWEPGGNPTHRVETPWVRVGPTGAFRGDTRLADAEYLEVTRSGSKLTLRTSADGKTWEQVAKRDVSPTDKLWVGVVAVNTLDREMTFEFTERRFSSVTLTPPPPAAAPPPGTVVLPTPEPPGSPFAAVLQARRDLVAAKEKELAAAKARFEAGILTRRELAEAEVGVFEAQLDGALPPDAVRLLGLILDRHETRRAVADARVKGGILTPDALHPINADIAQAKARLAGVRVPLPRRAADVIPFWVGTWHGASEVVLPAPLPGHGRGGGELVLDLVGDGKYLRGVGTEAPHPFQTLLVQTYDEAKDELRGWFYMSDGKASGPGLGRWDADARTLQWTEKLPDGLRAVNRFEFVDADTVRARLLHQNDKNEVVFDLRQTFTRQKAASVPRALPTPADRPPELAALDRLAGEWLNETTVKAPAPGAKDRTVTTIERGRPVLGGRLVEVTHSGGLSGTNDFWLTGYDPAAKLYRTWFFGADGNTAEFAGTWDAAAATMRLGSADGSAAGSWVFPTADRRDGRFTLRDPEGKAVAEMTSVSRRVPPVGKD